MHESWGDEIESHDILEQRKLRRIQDGESRGKTGKLGGILINHEYF